MSWLPFVIALALTTISAVMIEPYVAKPRGTESNDQGGHVEYSKRRIYVGLAANFFTKVFVLGAFLFLSLVVAAYAELVGWVAVGLTGAVAVIIIIWVIKLIYGNPAC